MTGRNTREDFPVTDDVSERLIRLPRWVGLEKSQQQEITQKLTSFLIA